MKLISKGHDYYDGAGMGVDEAIIFIRTPNEILDAPFELPRKISITSYHNFHFRLAILGGELFPFVKEERPYKSGSCSYERLPTRFHYGKESVLAALTKLEKNGKHRSFLGLRNEHDDIVRHFAQTPTKEQIDWIIENRVVTGIVRRRSIFDQVEKRHFDHIEVEANTDKLKEIEFFKVLDPATTHMRIANFIGGVLPHGPETVEISDKHKIQKAGHDPVTSFRMAKGTKKPRRRKS
jgi:hypothetical protein